MDKMTPKSNELILLAVALGIGSAFGLLAPYGTLVFGQSTDTLSPMPSPRKLLSFGDIEQPTLLTQSGNIYAFWNKDTDEDTFTFFKRSTDYGTSFGKSLNLVASLDLPGLSISNNRMYVTWEDYLRNAIGGEYNGIFLLTSNNGGTSFDKKIMLSQKDMHSVNPKIASSGNFVYVIWQGLPGNTDNFDIYFTKSEDGGVTFDDPINLSNNVGYSDLDTSDEGSVHIKTVGDNVYVIWKDDVNSGVPGPSYLVPSYGNKDDLFFIRSTDRGKTFTQPQLLANDVDYSKVIIDGFGQHVYVTIDDFGANKDLVILTSNDSGATFTNPINISNNAQGDSISDDQLLLNGNNVYVTWGSTKDAENDIFLRVSGDNGASFGDPINLSGGIHADYSNVDYWDNQSPKVAYNGPYLYVIWDNVVTTSDFDEIHNLIFRTSADNATTFGIPKIIAKDVGDESIYDVKGNNQNVYILFTDSPTKYNSESDSDSYELYFKKTSIAANDLEIAKQPQGTDSNYPKEITVSLNVENDPVILGGKQIINVAGYDTLSDDPLKGAKVDVTVDYGFATKKHLSGTLDDSGKASFTWTIGKFNIPGTYSVEAQVSAEGYGSTTEDTEFEVESESEDR